MSDMVGSAGEVAGEFKSANTLPAVRYRLERQRI